MRVRILFPTLFLRSAVSIRADIVGFLIFMFGFILQLVFNGCYNCKVAVLFLVPALASPFPLVW